VSSDADDERHNARQDSNGEMSSGSGSVEMQHETHSSCESQHCAVRLQRGFEQEERADRLGQQPLTTANASHMRPVSSVTVRPLFV